MKKIMPFISCLIIGFFFGYFMYNQYDKEKIVSTFSELKSTKVQFLQLGTYSSVESMEKNTIDFSYYIYEQKEDKYYVYIGITKDEQNLKKLKGYFKEKGYIIYSKEFDINNEQFLESLTQHDELLRQTTDEKSIQNIMNQILNKYEELKT